MTQKAGPSGESMQIHPAWIFKCKFNDFMVYIPPINNKLGPIEAPMASKTWVLRQ